VIDADGILNFNQSFDFNDNVLGACTTELTISGTILGGELSGALIIETTCEGCFVMVETQFSGELI